MLTLLLDNNQGQHANLLTANEAETLARCITHYAVGVRWMVRDRHAYIQEHRLVCMHLKVPGHGSLFKINSWHHTLSDHYMQEV